MGTVECGLIAHILHQLGNTYITNMHIKSNTYISYAVNELANYTTNKRNKEHNKSKILNTTLRPHF